MNAVTGSIPASSVGSLYSIKGKVALVTGACDGYGLAIAKTYAMAGARVYITSPDRNRCLWAANEAGGPINCVPLPMELNDENDCIEFARVFAMRENRLDILVNHVGTSWNSSTGIASGLDWKTRIDANCHIAMTLTRELSPLLKKSAVLDDPSRVINLGTLETAMFPDLDNLERAYAYSKASALNLTRLVGIQLGGGSVTVNAVARQYGTDKLGVIAGSPTDVPGMSVFLASRAGAYLNGMVMPVEN